MFNFHYDAGHGWLAVKVSLLEELGIQYDISRYSYLSKTHKTAYLEEDCDMARFMIAMKKAGKPVEISEIDNGNNSVIRSYTPYYCLRRETLVLCEVIDEK